MTERNRKALYAWLAGTAAFALLDYWASKDRVTFSQCARWVFRTHHPVGRATLGGALVILYIHLTEEKES